MTENSVVHVYCDKYKNEYCRPWIKISDSSVEGTGFCVKINKSKYIITNYHVVEYSRYISVKRRGDVEMYTATLIWPSEELDLAVLEVPYDRFWEEVPIIKLGSMPKVGDDVFVYGYPFGGHNVSVSRGIINRYHISQYSHNYSLVIQTDAAINPGNSGGPAVSKSGELVGIVFSNVLGKNVDSIGYLIPVNVIAAYIETINKTGNFAGTPSMGIIYSELTNRHKKALFTEKSGILVELVYPLESCAGILEPGDVITKIAEYPVSDDGTIKYHDIYMPFAEILNTMSLGDSIPLEIIRKGKPAKKTIKLTESKPIIPVSPTQLAPCYYIIGGLVFTVLSFMLLDEKRSMGEYVDHIVDIVDYNYKKTPTDQIIVLTEILRCDYTIGYSTINIILKDVNGIPVKNLRELRKTVESIKEDLVFSFDKTVEKYYIPNDAIKNTINVIADYGIERDFSENIYLNKPFTIASFSYEEIVKHKFFPKIRNWVEYSEYKLAELKKSHFVIIHQDRMYGLLIYGDLDKHSELFDKCKLSKSKYSIVQVLFVSSKYRRIGVGRTLLSHTVLHIANKHPLIALLDNEYAITLYEKCRFKVICQYDKKTLVST